MKRIAIVAFISISAVAFLHATPDRERYIVDILLGFSGDELIVLQSVYDNKGSHYDEVGETYLLIKHVEDSQLVLKKKIVIRRDSEITQYISNKEFIYAIPRMIETRAFHVDENNKSALYHNGTYYDIKRVLPRELWRHDIDRVEQLFEYGGHVFIVVDLIRVSYGE